jgi:hypothetical protein
MYRIAANIILITLAALIIYLIRRKNPTKKQRVSILFAAFAILVLNYWGVPIIEYYVVSIPSVQKAYNIRFEDPIVKVVENENGAYVISNYENDSITVYYFEKADAKWKTLNPFFHTSMKWKVTSSATLTRCKNLKSSTQLVMISVWQMDKPVQVQITDNYQTKFEQFSEKNVQNVFSKMYYAQIDSSIASYSVNISGNVITIE